MAFLNRGGIDDSKNDFSIGLLLSVIELKPTAYAKLLATIHTA